jgi:hypothetical protein
MMRHVPPRVVVVVATMVISGWFACGGKSGSNGTGGTSMGGSLSTTGSGGGLISDCTGQRCGAPCIVNAGCPDPAAGCVTGWCDNGRCKGGSLDCNVACSADGDCPPWIGQDVMGLCADQMTHSMGTAKCLQGFCRYVHWPICPEGGDASRYFHYDPDAKTCEQVLPQIQPLFRAAQACDPTRQPGSATSCSSVIEAPCCNSFVDSALSTAVLDYLGRVSQAQDMGCQWKTCPDASCPFLTAAACDSSSGQPVCVPH